MLTHTHQVILNNICKLNSTLFLFPLHPSYYFTDASVLTHRTSTTNPFSSPSSSPFSFMPASLSNSSSSTTPNQLSNSTSSKTRSTIILVICALALLFLVSSSLGNSNKSLNLENNNKKNIPTVPLPPSTIHRKNNKNNNYHQLHQQVSLGTQTLRHCHRGMLEYNKLFLASGRASWLSPKPIVEGRGVLLPGLKSMQDLAKRLTSVDQKDANPNLSHQIATLNTQTNFHKLFDIDYEPAQLVIPSHLKKKASAMFSEYKKIHLKIHQQQGNNNNVDEDEDDVGHIESQHIVTSTNLVTTESALFNELRKYRPGAMRHISKEDDEEINAKLLEKEGEDKCDFCSMNKTAVDVFGRVVGDHSFTASNIAKLCRWHGLLLNKRHHPLRVTKDEVIDWMKVSRNWFAKANKIDPLAKYPQMFYDAGPRASASQPHLHLQMMLTQHHYFTHTKNLLDRAYQYSYCENGGLRDYWRDWIKSHEAVGLALHYKGSWLVVSLTPVHDKEIFVIGNSESESFATLFHFAVNVYVNSKLQVRAFSMGMFFEKMSTTLSSEEDHSDNNNNDQQQQQQHYPSNNQMPAVARFMDRGAPFDVRNDVGAMEFYGSFNVGTDPFVMMKEVREMANKEGL